MDIFIMRFFRQIIWVFVLFLITGRTHPDSTIPRGVTPPSRVKKAAVRKDEKIANPTIELDLLGDGKTKSFNTKTVTRLNSEGDVDYSQLSLFRMKSNGETEMI